MEGLGEHDPMVESALTSLDTDLKVIDRSLARAKADRSPASLRAEVDTMRPAVRRVTVRIKQLYDAKEQEFFGALSGTLNAPQKLRAAPGRPERAGADRRDGPGPLAAPADPQGLRSAYQTLTAEVEERKAAERALRAS